MNQELKDTTIKMAEYSKNEVKIKKRKVISSHILCVVVCIVFLFGIFTASDYIAVSQFNQAPRFFVSFFFI